MKLPVEHPDTLLAFLLRHSGEMSRTTLKERLRHGCVAIDGRTATRHDTPLHPGEVVEIRPASPTARLAPADLRIVYEDEWLLAIDKPAGQLSIATDRQELRTAYRMAGDYLKRQNPRARIFVVHRLDRETSGLLLFAKSQSVQAMLQERWQETVIDRRYVAVTEGAPPHRAGTIDTWLDENRNHQVYVCREGGGKRAITHYRIIGGTEEHPLVELQLDTGRKNQIRVQMAWLGTPIVGDRKYGARSNPVGRLCLHARSLGFTHPVTGETIRLESPVPSKLLHIAGGDEKI